MPPSRRVCILGVPMDLGASHRGTDMGPSALRIAGLGPALRRLGLMVERDRDVMVPAMETRPEAGASSHRFLEEISHVCTRLAARVLAVREAGILPLVLGGDHSIAMGTVAGLAAWCRRSGAELGLVWFDAHGDMNTPETSPSGNIHGMPLAHLLGRGVPGLAEIGGFAPKVRPEKVALVGVRELDGLERRLLRDSGIRVFTMREIDERGMGPVAEEAAAVVTEGTAGFHLSFDVDGLDPAVAPGVGTPVPGGVSYREAHLLLEVLADTRRLLGMEVVELNPILDERNRSAEVVRQLVLSALGKSIL